MKVKYILFFGLVFLTSLSVVGQKSLGKLIDERAALYEKQEYLEDQKSTFWGTKSKKDLRLIIENLEEIIHKDSEIIRAVRTDLLGEQRDLRLQQHNTVSSNSDLESELNSTKNKHLNDLKKLREIENEVENFAVERRGYHWVLLFAFLIIVAQFAYIRFVYLRSLKK